MEILPTTSERCIIKILFYFNIFYMINCLSFAAYQLLDLLYDQNFSPSNFSTEMLVKTLEKYSQDDSFDQDTLIFWNSERGVPFSRILTKWGLCFNFNMYSFNTLLKNET